MAVLEVEIISKRFGGLQANAQAHLKVEPGKITALIGPNGAGKTTLFAIVSGFVIPDEGRVTFQGQDITGMQPFDICHLGLVRTFQIVQPFAGLTVRENIAVGAHLRERNRSAALDKASALAAKIGMKDMLDKPAQSLTIAGRKRLELANTENVPAYVIAYDSLLRGITHHKPATTHQAILSFLLLLLCYSQNQNFVELKRFSFIFLGRERNSFFTTD